MRGGDAKKVAWHLGEVDCLEVFFSIGCTAGGERTHACNWEKKNLHDSQGLVYVYFDSFGRLRSNLLYFKRRYMLMYSSSFCIIKRVNPTYISICSCSSVFLWLLVNS